MKKKCLAFLLALVMCLSLLPMTVFAVSDEEIRKTAEELAPYLPDMTVEQIIEILKREVTPEQDEAFNKALESLYPDFMIEDGVLTKYHGPGGGVVIPGYVTSIGEYAFSECSDLTSVVIPDSVTSIGEGAFDSCFNLTSVKIPDSVTSIGNSAFTRCFALTNVTIPSSVTNMGNYAFAYCTGMTSVSILANVTTIEECAFTSCSSLTSVNIPASVTEIKNYAFSNCKSLTSVTMQGVTDIGWSSFGNCDVLAKVTIPVSMKSIGFSAFSSCPSLTDVYYGGTEAQWKAIDIDEGNNKTLIDAKRHYGTHQALFAFADLSPTGFYLDPVQWAVEKKITTGKTATTFAPAEPCTHGQILTFLWRAAGEPKSDAVLPFETTGKEYYLDAAKWAYEKGMIGADFKHSTPCNRADAVSYIWQAAGKGAASGGGQFTDIPAGSSYAPAVAWAVDNGVTTGATATTFNPGKICSRGEIVTFLYRYFGK